MPYKGHKFKVGDLFAVPLEDGGYGVVLVTRRHQSVLAGYFFGPRLREIPDRVDEAFLKQKPAMVILFGYVDIRDGNWPPLGRVEGFKKEDWPNPKFRGVDYNSQSPTCGEFGVLEYADDNLLEPIFRLAPPEELVGLEDDGLPGSAGAAIKLNMRLPKFG